MLTASAGCTRSIKEGIGVFRRGQGHYRLLVETSESLPEFDSIKIGEFSKDYEPAPPALIPMMKAQLTQELLEKGEPVDESGGRALLIRGRVIYYEDSEAASKHVFGPMEEAIAIVDLLDMTTGERLGRAACVGRTNASVAAGVETKAEGLAEAIASWIHTSRQKPNAATGGVK